MLISPLIFSVTDENPELHAAQLEFVTAVKGVAQMGLYPLTIETGSVGASQILDAEPSLVDADSAVTARDAAFTSVFPCKVHIRKDAVNRVKAPYLNLSPGR